MAIDLELVPDLTPTVQAATDLRTHQRKLVSFFASGVNLADVRSATTGGVGLLTTTPNSGENVSISFAPNIQKAIAGEAIALFQVVQPMSASGLCGVTSGGNPAKIGIAWQAAANSGELFAVKFI